MARRFRGESVHKVDAKGHVSIPAPFRRVLEEGDPNSFRVRAYESAAQSITAQASDLGKLTVQELQKIDGVGKSTFAGNVEAAAVHGHIVIFGAASGPGSCRRAS